METSSEKVFLLSGCEKAISPSGSGSCPIAWGVCFKIKIKPIAASSPLMTLEGKNAATDPMRANPNPTWMNPQTNNAARKFSNDPRLEISAKTIAVKPGDGPLTLSGDPLKMPTTIPPIIPPRIPANNGAPEATATPRLSGRATKKTTIPAMRSFGSVLRVSERVIV